MKILLRFLALFALCACSVRAATTPIANPQLSGTGTVTGTALTRATLSFNQYADAVFLSGATCTFATGSSLTVNGSFQGTPSGGTLDLSALSLTLPSSVLLPSQATHSGEFLTTNGSAASWAALTKSSVGLANVDNTSDTAKPVSTATQTALDLKAPLASPTFTGTPILSSTATATSITAPAATTLALSGGSTGATLTLGQGTDASAIITPKGTGNVAFGSATYAAYRPKRSFPFAALPDFVVEGRGLLIYDDATGTPSGTPQAYVGVATRGLSPNSGFAGFWMADIDAPATSKAWEFHVEGGDGKMYIIQLDEDGQLTGVRLVINTAGDLSLSSTTSGTALDTAAITAKSIGLTENIRVGGLAAITGNLTVASNTASSSTTTGAVVVTGGLGVSAAANFGADVTSGTGTNFIVGGGFKAMRSGVRAALQLDTYDAATTGGSYVAGRRGRGTSGTPAAVATGDMLLSFVGRGWAATTNDFSGTVASLSMLAAEGFTNTAQGTQITLATTPIGSTTAGTAVTIGSDKSLTVAGTTEATTGGAGSVVTAGGVYAAKKMIAVGGVIASATGTLIDGAWSAVATLDFPSISAAGGVQDLTITVTGASVGDSVIVSENSATAIDSGVVLRGWVSASNTVTVRATNTTAGAIDPASASYRSTVVSF